MAIIKKYSPLLNLSKYQTFINDTNPNSDYFRITEFNETLTGGKCGFLIEGTPHLKETTELKIEVLDVEGNTVYFEPGNGIPEYYEGTSIVVAIHIYNDTPIGIGKITILGEAKTYKDINGATVNIPKEWDGVYNVKWEKEFKINKLLLNEDKVRFYKRPLITIDEIVKPIFTVTIPFITQTGVVEGIPEFPPADTNLSNWSAGTLYKLKTDGLTNWSSSQDDNTISIPEFNYTATIKEVLNSRYVLVDTPYTENNIVKPFPAASYTSSFNYTEAQVYDASALTGSYANIKISRLKTFVGDVARVKVYRRSKNSVGDFQFIQETKLESTELLRDLTINTENQISYGNFTENNLATYWTSSNANHPITIDDTILQRSAHIDYNVGAGGVQRLETINTIPVSSTVEYTLSFRCLLNGAPSNTKTLKAFISSSTFQQTFAEITSSNDNLQRVLIDTNIITTNTDDVKLVFEFTGDDWYISNVSLRNAAETSFSPDEFNLIQEIPRQLPIETYDFKFEFYDINNNYIPVDVRATKEFTGGNTSDSSQLTKFFTFTSDRTAFRFTTGSLGNPEFQQIGFRVTKNLLTGSVTYASSAYDDSGVYIEPSSYVGQYPGLFTNPSDSGATLTIGNYTGSDASIIVGSIVYTASLEDRIEYETIYRFEDAINISTLFASANSNQFFYEPTDLALRPNNQIINIQVERYNLDSNITPITVNSGSGKPPLTAVSDTNGKKTYTIAGTDYPHSAGITTYQFTASDAFGGLHSDELTITPLINFDGVSVNLTNEATSFKSLSTGYVTPTEYDEGDGEVFVSVGVYSIVHENELVTPNKFDIISASGSNCTPNEISPSGSLYGISDMSADTASLLLVIRYKAGDGSTIDFTKKVNYVKAKSAKPLVNIFATPQSQIVGSDTTFTVVGIPTDVEISVNEGDTNYIYNAGVLSTNQFQVTSVISGSNSNGTITPTTPVNTSGSNGVVTISYINSEGTPFVGKTINFNVGVSVEGISGSMGLDSKTVNLTTPTYTIAYDLNGNNPVPSGSLYLTASSQNVDSPLYKFEGDGISPDISYLVADTKSYTIPSTYTAFGNPDNIRVGVADGDQNEIAYDSITIFAVRPGVSGSNGLDGMTFVLTNDAHVFPASSTVVVSSYVGSGTQIYVYEGATELEYDGVGSSNGTWKIIATPTNITVGTFTDSGTYVTVGDHSAMGSGSDTASISYAISGSRSDGTLFNTTKIQSFSKSKTGTDGVTPVKDVDYFDGQKTATGFVYYTLQSATTPGAPTTGPWTDDYSFSTGLVTGLTGNWSNTPPAATGNGEYWYSKYYVVESSPGSLVGTPVFATTATNYSFTQLVTFTNLSTPGSTVIDGGNITTGNIQSTNWSANRGTLLELNNGRITIGGTNVGFASGGPGIFMDGGTATANAIFMVGDPANYFIRYGLTANAIEINTPNFAITSAGNVTVAGSITATTGAIGGWVLGTNDLHSVTQVGGGDGSYSTSGIKISSASTGYITAKQFYIDSSGNASFKGTINGGTILIGTNPNYFGVDSGGNMWVGGGSTYAGSDTFKVSNLGVMYLNKSLTLGNTGIITLTFASALNSRDATVHANGFVCHDDNIAGTSGWIEMVNRADGQTRTYITQTTAAYGSRLNIECSNPNSGLSGYIRMTTNGLAHTLTLDAANTGELAWTGNIIAYYSDERLKNIGGNIANSLDKINSLNGFNYTNNELAKSFGYTNTNQQIGVSAQQVQQVLPEVVSLAPFDCAETGMKSSKSGENYLTVDYARLVPLLIEGIKELSSKVDKLENEIFILTGKNK